MEGSDPLSAMAALDLTEETEQVSGDVTRGGDVMPGRNSRAIGQFNESIR